MTIQAGMVFGLLTVLSVGDDAIDLDLGETSATADDDGLGRHVVCRCRCGVRRVYREAEVASRARCGDACAEAIVSMAVGERDGIRTGNAEKYSGRPGVFAIGDSIQERYRRKLAENLDRFCDVDRSGEFEIPTQYAVVYPDGAMALADTFDDAAIMFRDRSAAAEIGATA